MEQVDTYRHQGLRKQLVEVLRTNVYAKNPNTTIEEVKDNLEMRDYIDSHREVSPLKQAKDARVLDNSNLTPEQQLKLALGWAKESISAA